MTRTSQQDYNYSGGSLSVPIAQLTVPRFILFALLSILTVPANLVALEVQCGFDGYVKEDAWFPVTVTADPSVRDFEVSVMRGDWQAKNLKTVHRVIGCMPDRPGVPGSVVCRVDSTYGTWVIRCEAVRSDGTRVAKDAKPKVLAKSDLIVLVLSDEPNRFDFLGSLRMSDRNVVRAFQRTPANFPRRWRDLDAVNLIILDGPAVETFSAEQREALAGWVAAGGTVVVTEKAMAIGASAAWGLFPDASVKGTGPRSVAVGDLSVFLGNPGVFVTGAKCIPLSVPEKERVLWDGDACLLAVRDMGCGRVLAIGLDWQNLDLRDRAFYEPVRRIFWENLIGLRRDLRGEWSVSRNLVTPKEARANYLVWYIAGFLFVYGILLGPINWLVLRFCRKPEWSIVTIPVGALVFSVVAFGLGLSLRSKDSILREAEVCVNMDAPAAYVSGIVGLLSPDRQPYVLAAEDLQGLLDVDRQGACGMSGRDAPREKDMLLYGFRGGPSLANVRIGPWAMQFFKFQTVEPCPGLSVTTRMDRAVMKGRIDNRLPFALKGAWMYYRWNKIELGDIDAGAAKEFALPLEPPGPKQFRRCANCHRYHGDRGWLTDELVRQRPELVPLKDCVGEIPSDVETRPVIVGWQDTKSGYVKIDRAVVDSGRRRLWVFPVDVYLDGPELIVPEGYADSVAWTPARKEPKYATDIRLQGVDAEAEKAAMKATGRKPEQGDPFLAEAVRTSGDSDTDDSPKATVWDFVLPFKAEKVATASLMIHWSVGEPEPDEPPVEGILSAYDWKGHRWVELARLKQGEVRIEAPDPGRFLSLPGAVVRVKMDAAAQEKVRRSPRLEFIEMAYEGRRDP